MATTDPIADMLTRIRNAITAKHETVKVPFSNEKKTIADILLQEGFIGKADVVEENGFPVILVTIKYDHKGGSIIQGLRRISKPGLRVYAPCEKLPRVINGLGISIISTNKGILTDKKAREAGVGGEVLAFVW